MYDFLLWLYPLINRIPKFHKQVIGRDMAQLGNTLLIGIIKANRVRGSQRVMHQQEISDNLDCLRILIRLCKDLNVFCFCFY